MFDNRSTEHVITTIINHDQKLINKINKLKEKTENVFLWFAVDSEVCIKVPITVLK